MSEENDIIVQAGHAFYCPEEHYICRAAIDIQNKPGFIVKAEHFTDWDPRICHGGKEIPVCPDCGRPWIVFSRGDK